MWKYRVLVYFCTAEQRFNLLAMCLRAVEPGLSRADALQQAKNRGTMTTTELAAMLFLMAAQGPEDSRIVMISRS